MAELKAGRQAVRRQNQRRQNQRRPRLSPDLVARARALVGVLLLLGVGLAGVFGARSLYGWLDKPIQEIVLVGDYVNFSHEEVAGVAEPFLHAGLLSMDMQGLAASLERQPWIAKAAVARIWPNRLQVSIEEHRPMMRWADRGLLSDTGHVIEVPARRDYSDLPLVYSEQSSPLQLMNQFRILATALEQVNLSIWELRQKPSGDWVARLRNGVPIELGSNDLRGKIQRIIRLWQVELIDVQSDVAGIDARYTNGLVVSWHSGAAPSSGNS